MCLSSLVLGQEENPCYVLPPPGTGFVNDPSHCTRYFSCVAFLAFVITCPEPMYFDETRLVCDFPHLVHCSSCPGSGVIGVSLPSFPFTVNIIRMMNKLKIEDPHSCTRWTLCVNGKEIPQECAPGTAFDPTTESCRLEDEVDCNSDTCATLPGGTGVAPSPDSCEAYHYCFEGAKLQRGQCQFGLAFDTVTMRCVIAREATCFPGTSVSRNWFASKLLAIKWWNRSIFNRKKDRTHTQIEFSTNVIFNKVYKPRLWNKWNKNEMKNSFRPKRCSWFNFSSNESFFLLPNWVGRTKFHNEARRALCDEKLVASSDLVAFQPLISFIFLSLTTLKNIRRYRMTVEHVSSFFASFRIASKLITESAWEDFFINNLFIYCSWWWWWSHNNKIL